MFVISGPQMKILKKNKNLLTIFCIALAVTLLLTTTGFICPELILGWLVLGIGFGLGKKSIGNKYIFAGLLFLLGSLYLAVPGSIWWGRGHWEMTLYHTVWMTPFLLLYLVNISSKVYYWLLPVILIHSIVSIVEYIISDSTHRIMGLLDNPNPAGALLAIGTVLLLYSKLKWLIILPFIGVIFSGSRSAFLTLVIVLTAVLLVEVRRARISIILPIIFVGVSLFLGFIVFGLSEPLSVRSSIDSNYNDLLNRWAFSNIPGLIPQGISMSWGLHSLYQRIAVELGILAAIVWVGITGYALYRRPWFNLSWWVLLSIVLLAITEYSVWLGPLAAIWWLTIGLRVKETYDNN